MSKGREGLSSRDFSQVGRMATWTGRISWAVDPLAPSIASNPFGPIYDRGRSLLARFASNGKSHAMILASSARGSKRQLDAMPSLMRRNPSAGRSDLASRPVRRHGNHNRIHVELCENRALVPLTQPRESFRASGSDSTRHDRRKYFAIGRSPRGFLSSMQTNSDRHHA